MTLQDFFISGLPTGNEPRSRAPSASTNNQLTIDNEKNQRLTRPSNSLQKSQLPPSKRILTIILTEFLVFYL
jgi:hypothetical protein